MINNDSLRIILQNRDGGPVYAETNLDRFIVEPWNTITALLFLIVAIFWFLKIRKEIKSHRFLFAMNILLTIGGIGGSIYHAFRMSRVFILMDWMPIMFIMFALSFYFFIRSTGKWWPPIILFLGVMTINGLSFSYFKRNMANMNLAISISYTLMGIAAIVPLIFNLIKTKMYKAGYFFITLISLLIAIISRSMDEYINISIGTHFLWHIFGAVGTFFIFYYLYFNQLYYLKLKK
ncbi:MAG: hypothetical protein Kow0068_26490 [Marinilabiliales bacterium]